MAEQYINKPPTEAELALEVRGVTYGQFSSMTEEAIHALSDKLAETAIVAAHASLPHAIDINTTDAELEVDAILQGALQAASDSELAIFRQFRLWRRFGIPDRTVTYSDMHAYMRTQVASRQEINPNYGAKPKNFTGLDEEDKATVNTVLGYVQQMREPFEYPRIDTYALKRTLGLDSRDIERLVYNGVLAPGGEDPTYGPTYLLHGAYYDYWLVYNYGSAGAGHTGRATPPAS